MGTKNILWGILVVVIIGTVLLSGCIEEKPRENITQISAIEKFSSVEEFKNYLEETKTAQGYYNYGLLSNAITAQTPPLPFDERLATEFTATKTSGSGTSFERVSETNVQVKGIDEPDIVKTDGKKIYFSPEIMWTYSSRKVAPPYYKEPKINIINAFPPTDLAMDGEINNTGSLLLTNDVLVIFSYQNIEGYDVSDPKSPVKKWNIKLNESTSIVTSRLYNGKIYLVLRNYIDEYNPCPIKPLTIGENPLVIECKEIYHPVSPVPIDITFSAIILNPISGEIKNKISFTGSYSQSIVYMSENAIYITYYYQESVFRFVSKFFREECSDLLSKGILEKIEKLDGYDISEQAKLMELQTIFEKYYRTLTNDERLKLGNEMNNRRSKYYNKEKRNLEKSGIVKIGLEKFEVTATGSVPGFPLNQFALDEYEENLRIATTFGERFGGRGFGTGGRESANDVYVLDKNLKIIGAIKDLGMQERIYSARFIGDSGYLVTFRETDPFYVLDLSNPKKPELKGELKIPGYSSYLHPITEDKILGIGKENWQVKISLFDVSQVENPKESDKYLLDESWSDILNTHHAFLLDTKHDVFFLPGSKGGYVFSYKDDKLKLIKAVSEISARRAIYINDYLYIIGDDKIVVLNENDWEKINEMKF